jgi:hypothetical protein
MHPLRQYCQHGLLALRAATGTLSMEPMADGSGRNIKIITDLAERKPFTS